MKKFSFIATAILALLAILLFMATPEKNLSPSQLIPMSKDKFGGSYTLTGHTGKEITDKIFEGQYQLLYFGFTYCPAICPTELSKMTNALEQLGTAADAIQPIFITVDPERDTVDVMRGYVEHFHPRLIGLTGSIDDIDQIKKDFKVYAQKVDDPDMTEYTVDHSSYIYFIAPDGRLLDLYKIDDSADYMVENMRAWMKHLATSSS